MKISCNSQTLTAKTPVSEEAEKHKPIAPGDDDLEGPYNFEVVPPTPKEPHVSITEKKDAPKEEKSFIKSSEDHSDWDDIVEYGAGGLRFRLADDGRWLRVKNGKKTGYDPPPYLPLHRG